MNILSEYRKRKTIIWLSSMLLSFTSYFLAMIIIRKTKFSSYGHWMYKGDLTNPEVYAKVAESFYQTNLETLYYTLPLCLLLDIEIRKVILPSVRVRGE